MTAPDDLARDEAALRAFIECAATSSAAVLNRLHRSEIRRFSMYVDFTDDCWLWTGSTASKGEQGAKYGRFRPTGKPMVQANRWLYEFLIGPITDGMQLDHLCRNPPCVRPSHLEDVTPKENTRRGAGRGGVLWKPPLPTECRRGHPYSDENTRRDASGSRVCKACHKENQRAHLERKASA